MKARIKVESFDSSMWGGMKPMDRQEAVYLVEEGGSISTTGLGQLYRLEIIAVRPGAVEVLVRPELLLHAEGHERVVGSLALEVGDTARLQTFSFDAWGNWVVSLVEIV